MKPRQIYFVDGHTVEEFNWAGERRVYIDGVLTPETFNEATARLSENLRRRRNDINAERIPAPAKKSK